MFLTLGSCFWGALLQRSTQSLLLQQLRVFFFCVRLKKVKCQTVKIHSQRKIEGERGRVNVCWAISSQDLKLSKLTYTELIFFFTNRAKKGLGSIPPFSVYRGFNSYTGTRFPPPLALLLMSMDYCRKEQICACHPFAGAMLNRDKKRSLLLLVWNCRFNCFRCLISGFGLCKYWVTQILFSFFFPLCLLRDTLPLDSWHLGF